jgi:hypothetical protein
MCGNACRGNARICNDGKCAAQCSAPGFTTCGGACVNLQNNKSHCGLCDARCGGELICQKGACACPTGTVDCRGMCADLLTDASNCGTCGTVCPSGQGCVGGACK